MLAIIDIEAVVDRTLPEFRSRVDACRDLSAAAAVSCAPPAASRGPFPPPPYWKVVCIGVLKLGDDYMPMADALAVITGEERAILRGFVRAVESKRPTIVGWNTRGYDLPVIDARCRRYGIPFPWLYGREARYRYSAEASYDLKDYLTNYGASRSWSLDIEARVMGLPGKLDVRGTDVEQMVADGRVAEVYDYCLTDVVSTGFVAQRVALARGVVTLEAYRAAASALWNLCEARGGMVAEVVRRADRARAMAEE
jgi:predicted PolB exonuclease-like 3'-5' exonuclease